MILEFIPRFPTKEVHEKQLFRNGISLKDFTNTLQETLGQCRGCIYTKKLNSIEVYSEFSSIAHLSILLKEIQDFHFIFVYSIGYFRKTR
jgi:hypothetical protein